jgi:hypothetical protein
MRKVSALVFVSLFIAAAAACGGSSTPDGKPKVDADCANIDVCESGTGTATEGQCPEGCAWDPGCKKCKSQRGVIIQQ